MKVIKENFVPVTTTLHGHGEDAEGTWWKSIHKKGGWGTGRFHGVTASGKLLCGTADRPNDGGGSCNPLRALQRWRDLPEAERKPGAVELETRPEMDPEWPKRPAGSLILKGYNRPLERGADGALKRMKAYADCQELSPKAPHWRTFEEPEPGRTFLWFSREQVLSLLPRDPEAGRTFPVPPAVADRLVRLPLLNTLF